MLSVDQNFKQFEECQNVKITTERLNEKFIQLSKKAEEKNEMQYLTDGIAMKRSIEEETEKLETKTVMIDLFDILDRLQFCIVFLPLSHLHFHMSGPL